MGRVRKKHLFLHAPFNIIATLLTYQYPSTFCTRERTSCGLNGFTTYSNTPSSNNSRFSSALSSDYNTITGMLRYLSLSLRNTTNLRPDIVGMRKSVIIKSGIPFS